MRIIAGEARGRTLLVPRDRSVRPPLDGQRESIFSILGDVFERRSVLDLYAGSGSFGLEAISRGARRTVFVESSPAALRLLEANVTRLGFGSRALVLRGSALRVPDLLDPSGDRFAVVFLDPPFAVMEAPEKAAMVLSRVREILDGPALEPDGHVVLRHPDELDIEIPFPGARERRHGKSRVVILQKDRGP